MKASPLKVEKISRFRLPPRSFNCFQRSRLAEPLTLLPSLIASAIPATITDFSNFVVAFEYLAIDLHPLLFVNNQASTINAAVLVSSVSSVISDHRTSHRDYWTCEYRAASGLGRVVQLESYAFA
jgi:hypothetical protein